MAAVDAILNEVIGKAVDTVEQWWATAAAAEEEEATGEEEEEVDIAIDDEGDGNDELAKWQKIRERDLATNRKRRVTFDAVHEANEEVQKSTVVPKGGGVSFVIHEGESAGEDAALTAEEHARRLEVELREAEEAAELDASAGGCTVLIRKTVVQFVNPGDISSSDDQEEDLGGEGSDDEAEWSDEEGNMWSALDPELLLKLQTLSAVLIQRAYRHYSARRASTPWASEVSWPASAPSGLFAEEGHDRATDGAAHVAADKNADTEDDDDAQELAARDGESEAESVGGVEAQELCGMQRLLGEGVGGAAEHAIAHEQSAHRSGDCGGGEAVGAESGSGDAAAGDAGISGDANSADAHGVAVAMTAAGELSGQIESAARAAAEAAGKDSGAGTNGVGKTRGGVCKVQAGAHVLRLARVGFVARGFENAAQVFVFLETGSPSGDVITGVELERGLRALKLDGQVDAHSLVAALSAKSTGKAVGDAHVSYKEFMRQLSMAVSGPQGGDRWGGMGCGAAAGKDNVALLEDARKRWKKTAERVR